MSGLFGPESKLMETAAGATSILVNATATVYTKAVSLVYGEYFALGYKATSVAGTAKITIQIEQSWILPTTEGASDGNWVIPDSMSDVCTDETDEVQHFVGLSPIPMKFMRFKITGGTGNPADTLAVLRLSTQENA